LGKAHNRLDLDISYISSEYISGRTAQDIASELGVSKKAVLNRLKEAGVQRRKPEYPDVTKEALLEMYINQKLSTRDIASKFGCSNKFIGDRLSEFGIPKRMRVGDPSFTEEERKAKWGKSREEHNMWKGGVTGLNETLRYAATDWRLSELKRGNFTCFVTGQRGGDLQVHHITPFHEIRDRALSEVGVEMRQSISDYDEETIRSLRNKIAELHEIEEGYVLEQHIHKIFHSLYGFKTTLEDLMEFKARYNSGELSQAV
jgi:transposase